MTLLSRLSPQHLPFESVYLRTLVRRLARRSVRLTVVSASQGRLDGADIAMDGVWPRPPPTRNAITLRLDPQQVLYRQVRAPTLIKSRRVLCEMVRLNLMTWTGYSADEVYWTARATDGGLPNRAAIDIAVADAVLIDAWRAAAEQRGYVVRELDLGLAGAAGVRFDDPRRKWTTLDTVLAVVAAIACTFAAYVDFRSRETAIRNLEATSSAIRRELLEQAQLNRRFRAATNIAQSPEHQAKGTIASSLAQLSAQLADIVQLDELTWASGTVTLRISAIDPDAVLGAVSKIARAGSVETIGATEATMVRGERGYRVHVRYRTLGPL